MKQVFENDFVWSLTALSLNITRYTVYYILCILLLYILWDEYTWNWRIKLISRTYFLLNSKFFRMLMTSIWHHKRLKWSKRDLPFYKWQKAFQRSKWCQPLCGFGSTHYYVDMHSRSVEWLNWNSTNMVHLLLWDWDCLPLMLKISIGTIMKELNMCILCIDILKWQSLVFCLWKGWGQCAIGGNKTCLEWIFSYNYCFW